MSTIARKLLTALCCLTLLLSGAALAAEDPAIVPSHESGFYAAPFELILSYKKGDIYYTTDGSDPTASATARLYEGPIPIAGRAGDANVVSAVDPLLFSGSFNYLNGNTFMTRIAPPEAAAVDKCTVIRAAVKQRDGSFTAETSLTYFIGTLEEHIQGAAESCAASGKPLAVLSIAMNYEDLFDSRTGIYVKGDLFDEALAELRRQHKSYDAETARALNANYKQKGREWERKAAITLFEVTAESADPVLTQLCGIRIQGNYSRSDLQKGFRLYARRDYGEKNFEYPVFGEDHRNVQGDVMDKYDTLTLRNGGNCAFTSKFNDAYWQSLVTDLHCATQANRPCVVYLNGEYWGLYILQEDYTNDHMADYYGVEKDDVIIYKGDAEALELGYKLDEGDLPEGITDETYYFHDLLAFFDSHADLRSDADYAAFTRLVDPDSVLDYFAVQCFIDNKWDWPGKNWSMWKTTSSGDGFGDGRWRYMFYDIEFGGVCGRSDARNNTLKNANYKPNGLLDMDTDNPAVLCFAYLMTNEGFRERFCDQLEGLSSANFEKTAALARLDHFTAVYEPLYPQFFARYPGAGSARDAVHGGYATPKCIRDFLAQREKNIAPMLDFCRKTLQND